MAKIALLKGLCDEEWDEDDNDLIDEEEGHCPDNLEVEGPSYAPVFTGLLDAQENPILRHPVVLRLGFHPERNKYHVPTLEDTGFDEAEGKVFGWVYDS
ncbi:hypothetical protein [Phaeobacter phage MD18]|nr:hypothetical protein [Phaeobacter phage MD18]